MRRRPCIQPFTYLYGVSRQPSAAEGRPLPSKITLTAPPCLLQRPGETRRMAGLRRGGGIGRTGVKSECEAQEEAMILSRRTRLPLSARGLRGLRGLDELLNIDQQAAGDHHHGIRNEIRVALDHEPPPAESPRQAQTRRR